MRMILLAFAAALPALMTTGQPANAEVTYPWCANYASPGSINCGFSTLEQCQAALSGNGGWCLANPMYRPGR